MKPETKFGFDGESSLTNIKNKNNIKLTRLVRFLFQVIDAKKSSLRSQVNEVAKKSLNIR